MTTYQPPIPHRPNEPQHHPQHRSPGPASTDFAVPCGVNMSVLDSWTFDLLQFRRALNMNLTFRTYQDMI